jgi:periplasmic protein TonB
METGTAEATERLGRPMAWSAALHVALLGTLALSSVYSHRGELWGGPGGGTIQVGLVGSVPGISLPRPNAVTESRVVDASKGLYKSAPEKPKPEANAVPLPKFERNNPPKYHSRASRVLENPTKPPPNAVPYGGGGAPSIPYSSFTMGAGTAGGMGFSAAGAGNFGARFPWYVQAVQRRISTNWLQSTINPGLRWAPRVVVDFQILRDGSISNIQILQSSGDQTVDTSAVRAVQNSSPVERLPAGYGGSYVNVEFWFDFHR